MNKSSKHPLKVFVWHATGDQHPVTNVSRRLIAEGMDAWLDTEKILPGQNWRLVIAEAVKSADVIVICLSKRALIEEGRAQRQIKYAIDIADEKPQGAIFLIPARLDDCDIPEYLCHLESVDLFNENGFGKLLNALKWHADEIGAIVESPLTTWVGQRDPDSKNINNIQPGKPSDTNLPLELKKAGRERSRSAKITFYLVLILLAIGGVLGVAPIIKSAYRPTPAIPTQSSPSTLVTISSPTAIGTILPTETPTAELNPTNTTAPVLPDATAIPTYNPTAVMHVIVTSNQTTGKAPLVVKFDARGSYVQAPDGTIYECRKGACRYSWYILLNGQQFARPDTTSGTLEFKFQKKGIYSISVYICHGSTSPTCGNDAILVIVN